MKDLFAAVCLVAVLEGLFLFVAPFAWKRMAERLLDMPSPALRSFGGLVLLAERAVASVICFRLCLLNCVLGCAGVVDRPIGGLLVGVAHCQSTNLDRITYINYYSY